MRICGHKLRWDFFERRLADLCRRYSLIVADYPIPFIIVPILITGLCMGGWLFKNTYNDTFELFTPQGAQSRKDQRAIADFFPDRDGTYIPGKTVMFKRECSAFVTAKDGGNILRYDVSKSVENLNEYIMHNIMIYHNGTNYTFQDLCMKSGSACYNNPQIYIIPLMFASSDAYTNLSYPTATYDNRQHFYLGSTLGGVTLDPVSKRILDAKCWALSYKLKDSTDEENELSKLFELQYQRVMLKYNDPLINVYISHSQSLDLEVKRNADHLTPRFVLMFTMLIVFAVICTLSLTRPAGLANGNGKFVLPVVDWTLSRPFLAFMGVTGALMGVGSAIGILCYFQVKYPDMINIMPFLIVAVRLDNTFLMIAALDNTKRTLPVRERVSEAMSEAAVSIFITVLTDIFSFAFGVLTDFLAVQLFSIYTTVAIIVTWVYQLTFLLAFLTIYARLEEKHRHSVIPCISTVSVTEYKSRPILTRLFCMGTRPSNTTEQENSNSVKVPLDNLPKIDQPPSPVPAAPQQVHSDQLEGTPISRWFRDSYGRFLMKTRTKISVLVGLAVFWAISIYGCMNLRLGLEPIKLLVGDSYAVPYYQLIEKYYWNYGAVNQIVFFNPGDLTNPNQRQRILDALDSFAKLEHSTGKEGIDFWMIAFDRFLDKNEDYRLRNLPAEMFYKKLNYFLYSFKDNLRYRLDVAFQNGTGPGDNETNPIVAIRAMMGIKGFGTLDGQQETMDSVREVASEYSDTLNISVFDIMFLFVDQYEDIWPNVAQEIYCCMGCMVAISLLLIPHPICAIWVTFAILSIDVGVVGFMTLWGLNMDTISMITIIMSIGFSVDFSAHIAYAYVVNIHEEPDERVCKALGSLGWPVLQGGLATMLGVIFLATTQSYMVVSFFKTVFLVIIFGLVHGLVFLPVLLRLLMPAQMCGFQCIRSQQPDQNSASTQPQTRERTKEKKRFSEIWKNCFTKFGNGKMEAVNSAK